MNRNGQRQILLSSRKKEKKTRSLEAPEVGEERLGGDTGRSQAVPGPAQQWNMDGGGCSAQAAGQVGQREDLKKRQTEAITTWTKYNPGKDKSKILHLNPAGKKDGAICWDGQRKQHR